MPYLFDTDALSLLLKPRNLPAYAKWVISISRQQQFASAVSIGELFKGAYRRPEYPHILANIERLLPGLNVLAYDADVARTYGKLRAELERIGKPLEDADMQIAATAVHHDMELVTGNVRHFSRVPGLRINRVIEQARLLTPT